MLKFICVQLKNLKQLILFRTKINQNRYLYELTILQDFVFDRVSTKMIRRREILAAISILRLQSRVFW